MTRVGGGSTQLAWVCVAATLIAACGSDSSDEGRASARVAQSRSEMVGGTRALGDAGDILLENEKIRLVIQKQGFSRGFGVYGGGLLDADLRRPQEAGSSGEALGNDQFAELFPAMLVQAVNVDRVEIVADGKNGGPALVEASGNAGDFIELVGFLNRAVNGSNETAFDPNSPPRIRYSTTYELQPKKQYVTTRFRIQNISEEPLNFPGEEVRELAPALGLDLTGFTVPIADIALFGATNKLFAPGVGFDLRFGLGRSYDRGIDFPAFPGIVTDFIAARASNVSYGLIVEESDRNYVFNKASTYADGRTPITKSSVLIPFVASGFLALFYEDAPASIPPGGFHEVVKHFIVGSGDVGSVVDIINEIRGIEVGHLGGQVENANTGAPDEGLSAIVYQRMDDGFRRPFSQYNVRENGSFGGTLAPGSYSLKVVGDGRPGTAYLDFEIAASQTTALRVASTPPGRIMVRILDQNGDSLPSKATAVGRYGPEFVGLFTPQFLFDLEAGEEFRSTDLIVDDANDPSTREFIEDVAFTANGVAELLVRPGTYEIVSSRGPEYDIAKTSVTVRSSETASVDHLLKRVIDTPGWVALDAHVHSHASIDSGMNLDERVVALAAEGVEVAVSTDHNFVTDYAPYVARNDLTRWLHPIVGLEMTTLESGHFNGYPLRYDVGPITHGSFEWARRPPDVIFEELRNLGSLGPDETIVQVNHPRDDLIGYYNQFYRNPLTTLEDPPTFVDQFVRPFGPAFIDAEGKTTFSNNYDAVELVNGKLYFEIRHYRVPDELPPGDLPERIPPAGTILREENGDVAYPGVVDDWFNLLNLGHSFTGMGTGDSHSGFDEAGQFRTMVRIGVDSADAVTDQMITQAIRNKRALSTNGPMIDFWIDDPETGAMGSTVRGGESVSLHYSLTSAPWIGVGRVNVYRNGVIAHSLVIEDGRDLSANPIEETLQLPVARNVAGTPIDSWFVIEAIGYDTMFPVIRAADIPPLVLTDALASLAGPLGLGGDEFGDLRPPEVFPVTAYAITNPVWVDLAGDGFNAPGVVPAAIQARPENDPKFQAGIFENDTVTGRKRTRQTQTQLGYFDAPGQRNVPLFYPMAGDVTDVRRVLSRLGALGRHGHPE